MAEEAGSSERVIESQRPRTEDNNIVVRDDSIVVGTAVQSETTQHLYQELLGKTSLYLKSEFEVTAEDYRLIQQMNKVSKDKYEDLLSTAKNVKSSLGTINDRFTCIKPFLERIDSVEAQVNDLEGKIFRLDTYAKQLGKNLTEMVKNIF